VGHAPSPGRELLVILEGGASCLYEGRTYFERNMGARIIYIYIGRHSG
jgi:hypothetical protein